VLQRQQRVAVEKHAARGWVSRRRMMMAVTMELMWLFQVIVGALGSGQTSFACHPPDASSQLDYLKRTSHQRGQAMRWVREGR
jgi:hypothetical protein